MMLSKKFYKAIIKMRCTTKRTEKEKVLIEFRSSPTFRQILYSTYSPYLRYHIRKIPVMVVGEGWNELGQPTWELLNSLALRKITGIAARETLFEHMKGLTPHACEILRLIITKDLKCGIAATTINKIHGSLIPVFECQLVEDWDAARAVYPVMVGAKLDCIRGEYRNESFYTRKGLKVTGVDHITKYLKTIGSHLYLSGELYIPGMAFHRASGIIRSNKPQKLNARFAVFDIPNDNSIYTSRHEVMRKTFYPLGTRPSPPAMYIPHKLCRNEAEVMAFFNNCIKMGYEGIVTKYAHSFSKMGKSYDWMRIVNGISAEYQILNVYESEKKPGYLGGIIIEGGIRVGSGFSDPERIAYLKKPELILGKYATIVAKEKTKSGSLRQPIWKEIRWDI